MRGFDLFIDATDAIPMDVQTEILCQMSQTLANFGLRGLDNIADSLIEFLKSRYARMSEEI